MRKEVDHCQNKKYLSKLTVYIFVGLLFFLVAPKAHAFLSCEPDRIANWNFLAHGFCAVKKAHTAVDMVSSSTNFATAMTTEVPATLSTGGDTATIGACATVIAADRAEAIGFTLADLDAIEARGNSLFDEIDSARAAGFDCDYNSTALGARSTASLMGLTNIAYNVVSNEAPPTSLNYYAKHNLRKMPVIGQTAYAQNTNYNAVFGLELALRVWEKTRNLAYAMMSVIMLVIGILIITRKKINPQTVVSVQTALPRVVISLILITFSYPIGALFIAAIQPLTAIAIRLVWSARLNDVERLADMDLLISYIGFTISILGSGLVGVIIGVLMLLITLIVFLISIIKVILLTTKMVLQIIVAPVQFAIAAIPGQEKLVEDWFRQMAAKMLAIPAIWFLMALAWYFITVPFVDPEFFRSLFFVGAPTAVQGGLILFRGTDVLGSTTLTMLVLPIISISIMFFAIRADKAVEGFILGDKKRR